MYLAKQLENAQTFGGHGRVVKNGDLMQVGVPFLSVRTTGTQGLSSSPFSPTTLLFGETGVAT